VDEIALSETPTAAMTRVNQSTHAEKSLRAKASSALQNGGASASSGTSNERLLVAICRNDLTTRAAAAVRPAAANAIMACTTKNGRADN
jgi:hypothetical protein